MNSLERSLVEKAGYDSGFEFLESSSANEVVLASARHPAKASITKVGSQFEVQLSSLKSLLLSKEVRRSFPDLVESATGFYVYSEMELAKLLRRAASLSYSLPNQAANNYHALLEKELEALAPETRGTEIDRLVRQRVGQQSYRSAMMDYWGGACAVTGISVAAVLRASHSKPWAECDTDNERLNVFNGFLLSANLDALFDRFLITFDDNGELVASTAIPAQQRALLGINKQLKLRWIANEHLPFIHYHRERFEEQDSQYSPVMF
ncbi:MAG TPA: HNH endonuclease [Gammaproteobacteria bacterium]|nr:HNH endonuclease [Gammaproteobacteria bacterium]